MCYKADPISHRVGRPASCKNSCFLSHSTCERKHQRGKRTAFYFSYSLIVRSLFLLLMPAINWCQEEFSVDRGERIKNPYIYVISLSSRALKTICSNVYASSIVPVCSVAWRTLLLRCWSTGFMTMIEQTSVSRVTNLHVAQSWKTSPSIVAWSRSSLALLQWPLWRGRQFVQGILNFVQRQWRQSLLSLHRQQSYFFLEAMRIHLTVVYIDIDKPIRFIFLIHFVSLTIVACNEDDVCLYNGSSTVKGDGMLQICSCGQWVAICDYCWSKSHSILTCKELGYTESSKNPKRSHS